MGLKPALFWFSIVAVLVLVWKLLDLPSEEETIVLVTQWLIEYGLLLVLVGAFLETILFVGFYFPGSAVLFLAVALSPDPLQAVKAVVAISLGMLAGYSLNYILGAYGWHKIFLKLGMKDGIENARAKMEKDEVRYIFYTYWNPGLGSFTSTAAGILKLPYRRFVTLTVMGIMVWNIFWGVLVYSLGESALMLLNLTLVLQVIAVWILFELGLLLWRRFSNYNQSSLLG